VKSKKIYIETYGCQMNVSDSEIVTSILKSNNHEFTTEVDKADVVLLNTCSIRENAEKKILGRLSSFQNLKARKPDLQVGVLGCMAEHQGSNIVKESPIVNLVVGPDQYRKLPELIDREVAENTPAYELDLSKFETYSDIYPSRKEGVSGWVTITRGCNNFCTYCVVPYTRGRERSRSVKEIIDEAKKLLDEGYKEVYLLGQNVNSYKYEDYDFADLLENVAKIDGLQRLKFITSHPKDFNEKLVDVIAENSNISRYIHLPFQAGSDRILKKMNRRHKIDEYFRKVDYIKKQLPDVGLSTDIIVGYPTETEVEFQNTLDVVNEVKFDSAFVFKYSPREGTKAYKLHHDDIPDEEKVRRLMETDKRVRELAFENYKKILGTEQEILIESISKKNENEFIGKIDRGLPAVVEKGNFSVGDFAKVKITDNRTFTLVGEKF
jgi:tRNA-2-methylthio-N6-dimethylallyladenosine synthase